MPNHKHFAGPVRIGPALTPSVQTPAERRAVILGASCASTKNSCFLYLVLCFPSTVRTDLVIGGTYLTVVPGRIGFDLRAFNVGSGSKSVIDLARRLACRRHRRCGSRLPDFS